MQAALVGILSVTPDNHTGCRCFVKTCTTSFTPRQLQRLVLAQTLPPSPQRLPLEQSHLLGCPALHNTRFAPRIQMCKF